MCFFIVNQNTENHYAAMIFSLLLFSVCQLFLLCIAGNWPTDAVEALTIEVYEKIEKWNLKNWLQFRKIRKMKAQFETNIWQIFTIKQSSILTSLGFALGYIVVLLQTENFGENN